MRGGVRCDTGRGRWARVDVEDRGGVAGNVFTHQYLVRAAPGSCPYGATRALPRPVLMRGGVRCDTGRGRWARVGVEDGGGVRCDTGRGRWTRVGVEDRGGRRGQCPHTSVPVAGCARVMFLRTDPSATAPGTDAHRFRDSMSSRRGEGPQAMCLRAFVIRRLPTLPRSYPRSTIGSRGLNGRVRDGNGCDPSDTVTGNSKRRLGGGE